MRISLSLYKCALATCFENSLFSRNALMAIAFFFVWRSVSKCGCFLSEPHTERQYASVESAVVFSFFFFCFPPFFLTFSPLLIPDCCTLHTLSSIQLRSTQTAESEALRLPDVHRRYTLRSLLSHKTHTEHARPNTQTPTSCYFCSLPLFFFFVEGDLRTMFRVTWGCLGGSITRRGAATAARSSAAVLPQGQKARTRSMRRRRSLKPVRRRSSTSNPSCARPSRHSNSPIARNHPASGDGDNAGKVGNARVAQENVVSSSTSLANEKRKSDAQKYALARPAYMSAEREQEVLEMAERMQRRDLTTEVPVASFAYEILKAHPSVRNMGLRERMDFLLHRWSRLNKNKKLEYINDPLRGLL